jgi:hypothetical protein
VGGIISRCHPLNINLFDIYDLEPAAPAVGDDLLFTCPAGVRLELLYCSFQLNPDGVGGARGLPLMIYGSGSLTKHFTNFRTTATPIYYIPFPTGSLSPLQPASVIMPFEAPWYMEPGNTLVTEIANMGVGDVINKVSLRFKRWVNT